MKKEYFVIGVTFDHRDDQVTLYLRGEYDSRYPRWLAMSINYALEHCGSDPDKFRFYVIQHLAGEFDAQMTAVLPPNDHTVHVLDVNNARVRLLSSDGLDEKVSFGITQFVDRYRHSL